MYCGHCGDKLNEGDRFCGTCGQPIILDETMKLQTATTIEQVKKPLNPKTKKWIFISSAIMGIFLLIYVVAQSFNGPSTPEELQQKFTDALNQKNVSELKGLLTKDSEPLTNSSSLDLFKNSLDEQVINTYTNSLAREVDNRKFGGENINENNWLTVVKESSWIGDSFKVHIVPFSLVLEDLPSNQLDVSVGDVKFSKDGKIEAVWPSNYGFKGTISNELSSETVNGKIELNNLLWNMENSKKTAYVVNLSPLVENQLNLQIPNYLTDAEIFINGKKIKLTGERTIVAPVPKKMNLEVKGKVLGVAISDKEDIELEPEDWVATLVDSAIAKKSLSLFFEAADSWTKAYNNKKPEEIKGMNPNSDFYKLLIDDIKQKDEGSPKFQFQKVVVNPSAVTIDEAGININVAEYYLKDNYDEIVSWNYRLTKVPEKSEWWIEEGSTSFYPVEDTTGEYTKAVK